MNTISKATIAMAACTLITSQPVGAQRVSEIRVGIQQTPANNTQSHRSEIAATIRKSQKSHWKEGAVIGTILVGTPAAIWMGSYGEISIPEAILGGLISGAITGGVLGAVIGGQFPKGG